MLILALTISVSPTWALPNAADLMQTVNDTEAQARASIMPTPNVSASETVNIVATSGDNITAALQAAINDPAIRLINIPAGTFKITSVNLDKAQNKVIQGQGTMTILESDKSVQRASFIATSSGQANRVLFTEFILDQNWQPGDFATNAFQLTNTDSIHIYRVAIKNVGQAGILAQGFGGVGKGSPNLLVVDTLIDGAGLVDGTTGFGILVKDNSPNARIIGNRVINIKGGMGIGANTTSLGSPTDMVIIGNYISMVQSTVNYEGIGITRGADGALVARNVTDPSFDNGMSLSSNNTIAIQNYVSSARNHGIAIVGEGNVILGNQVGPIGLQNAALGETMEYGAITIENGRNNIIIGNEVIGGDMAFAVKFNGTQGGQNQLGANQLIGWRVSEYNRPPLASDTVNVNSPQSIVEFLTSEQRLNTARWAGPTTPSPAQPGGGQNQPPTSQTLSNSPAPTAPNTGYTIRKANVLIVAAAIAMSVIVVIYAIKRHYRSKP